MWSVYLASVSYFLTVLASAQWTEAANDCSFVRSYKNEECVYNIHLTHNQNCGPSPSRHFFRSNYHDNIQNDYNEKIDTMEKTFSFLKDEHEQRLQDLEGTVKALLRSDPSVAPGDQSLDLKNGPAKSGSLLDDGILTRLHEELGKLRTALSQKTQELFDVQFKINETEKMFRRTQIDMLNLNENLMNAENKIAILERERAVLKNQLKDRSYKLDVSSGRLTECEAKSKEQEEQLLTLIRSENTLSEGLMTCELTLNNSKAEMKTLERAQQQIKSRHKRIRQVLRIRERELIDCYGAKTQTFCGFETSNMCGFSQASDRSDFFDWGWAMGRTPSYGTGPSRDHTCGTPDGHFMYIEASAKRRGRNAIIYSPLYRGMNQQCVEFYYHMFGRHIGTLNVYAKARGAVELTSVWRAWGNQGDIWSVARLAIPKPLARAGYQIAFEGITEQGYLGDISIDDVSVTDGECEQGEVEAVRVQINPSSFVDEDIEHMSSLGRRRRLNRKGNMNRKKTGN